MIRPAFSSTGHAAAFALLLLTLLLLPVVVGQGGLPPREDVYSSFWWANGPFPYIHQQIFEEQGDIDIAFVGSSHMLHGIDTPFVQEQLSKDLGRPAIVRSICWGGAGFDALYFITHDLMQHRKVRMLVFYDDFDRGGGLWADEPNNLAYHWFRLGDNAESLSGLSLRFQLSYYFAALVGMPRNLLDLVRTNIHLDLISSKKNYLENLYRVPNPATRLGSMSAHLGFGPDPGPTEKNAPFVDFIPVTNTQPSDVAIYSPATKDIFEFSGPATPSMPLHFVRELAKSAKQQGTKLVLLHVPVIFEMRDRTIREREFWPDVLQTDIAMVGIPSGKLFSGLTDDDVRLLFYNPAHLNKNGQEYFTRIITPALLQIYDSHP